MNEYVREPAYTTAEPLPRTVGGVPVDFGAIRSVGPKYAPHDADAPLLQGKDVAGLVIATVMALGPFAAYAAGFGL